MIPHIIHSNKFSKFILVIIIWLSLILPIPTTHTKVDNLKTNNHSNFCTIFSVSLGKKVFFGNNEDYRFKPETSFISFIPPQEIPNFRNLPSFNDTLTIYGNVVVGSILHQNDQTFFSPQGGMNDQGLCFDANSIPKQTLNSNNGDWNPMDAHSDILWYCKTVEDVIAWYETHPVKYSPWNGQWNYVDASGAGVVVTATDGELVFIEKNTSYLISTNFNLADPSSHYFDYPCWRFDKATDLLAEIGNEADLTVQACRDVLDATHFEPNLFDDLHTMYSTIYDPIQKKIYLYFLYNFEEVVVFDIEEEYNKVNEIDNNHSFHSSLNDKSYLMKNFFNKTKLNVLTLNNQSLIIIIGTPSILIFVVVMYRKKKKKKNHI
ncbi:MAG: hypothetical protein ACFFAJ_10520 [Candidatus Hodarchaeota archaeon]